MYNKPHYSVKSMSTRLTILDNHTVPHQTVARPQKFNENHRETSNNDIFRCVFYNCFRVVLTPAPQNTKKTIGKHTQTIEHKRHLHKTKQVKQKHLWQPYKASPDCGPGPRSPETPQAQKINENIRKTWYNSNFMCFSFLLGHSVRSVSWQSAGWRPNTHS